MTDSEKLRVLIREILGRDGHAYEALARIEAGRGELLPEKLDAYWVREDAAIQRVMLR